MRLENSNHDKRRENDTQSAKHQAETQRISVSRMVQDLVLSLGDHFASSHITVEMDIQPLEAVAQPRLIKNAMKSLVRHALQSMPRGGELSVTLIDSPYQWELEIADTSSNRFVEAALAQLSDEPSVEQDTKIFAPTVANLNAAADCDDLTVVQEVADAHGGHLQSWNCPQGGTANVLVIPRRHKNAA